MEELKTAKGISYTIDDYVPGGKLVSIGQKDKTSFAIIGNHHKRNGYYLDYKIIASEVPKEDVKRFIEAMIDEITFYAVCRKKDTDEFIVFLTILGYPSFVIHENLILVGSSDSMETAEKIRAKKEKEFKKIVDEKTNKSEQIATF